MQVIKSFFFGKYAATEGDKIEISDKKVAEMLVKKGIIKAEERSGVNVNKENKN